MPKYDSFFEMRSPAVVAHVIDWSFVTTSPNNELFLGIFFLVILRSERTVFLSNKFK